MSTVIRQCFVVLFSFLLQFHFRILWRRPFWFNTTWCTEINLPWLRICERSWIQCINQLAMLSISKEFVSCTCHHETNQRRTQSENYICRAHTSQTKASINSINVYDATKIQKKMIKQKSSWKLIINWKSFSLRLFFENLQFISSFPAGRVGSLVINSAPHLFPFLS